MEGCWNQDEIWRELLGEVGQESPSLSDCDICSGSSDSGDEDLGREGLDGHLTPVSSVGEWPIPPAPPTKTPSSRFPSLMSGFRSKEDWDYQKNAWGISNRALDSLLSMIGLGTVKEEFIEISTWVATAKRQKVDLSKENFGVVLVGNPGTGKTRVAKLYAKFLYKAGVIPCRDLVATTGTSLAADGVQGAQKLLHAVEGGGVLFVDDAHHVLSPGMLGGTAGLDHLLSQVENLRGEAVFIFAGHPKQMVDFAGHNAAFSSLIPTTIQFQDYQDPELHLLLVHELKLKFGDQMLVEEGLDGRFMRIVARRTGRGRGRLGFGNAREVQNALSAILRRQANRLFRETRAGQSTDDFFLSREDLIGPPPVRAFATSKAWKKLQGMIGLQKIKDAVNALIHRLQLNYERELEEQPLIECSLNRLFLGSPGTGKTTVAKLYGELLVEIGMLSRGEVVVKSPADFIGDALGQSERNTKAILDATRGKVLVIDEAYMLGGTGDRSSQSSSDPFRTAVVDTIVGEVQSNVCEDRCVLLLGYTERMTSMLNNVNPALARRFPLASAFVFDDYSKEELRQILDLRLSEQGYRATDRAKVVALEVLSRAQTRPQFGNAGEVDILLDQAKERQHRRLLGCGGPQGNDLFLPRDMDEDCDRDTCAIGNIRSIFSDFVGCEPLIKRLEGYQRAAKNVKSLGHDPREVVPFSFLFCGPPGTGKTTTAQRMGAVFYEMGFLSTKDVVECSATDLIGEYVGHTGPKTKRLFDSALGKVLFIDEAYKLSTGAYGKEAIIEIINNLTKDRYRNKLVIILAGYEDEINGLMAINAGLKSRFPDVIRFNNLSVTHSIELLFKNLRSKGLDTSMLEGSNKFQKSLEVSFRRLFMLPAWGNARDIHTLSKAIVSNMMSGSSVPASLKVTQNIVLDEAAAMLKSRQRRATSTTNTQDRKGSPEVEMAERTAERDLPPPAKTHIRKEIDVEKTAFLVPNPTEKQKTIPTIQITQTDEEGAESPGDETPRDLGVSNEVWDQLNMDKQGAKYRDTGLSSLRNINSRLMSEVTRSTKMLQKAEPGSQTAEQWGQVLREMQRRRDKVRKALEEKEEAARKEKEVQDRLKVMGKCEFGYNWIKQADGYRCAGGMHFVGFEELDRLT